MGALDCICLFMEEWMRKRTVLLTGPMAVKVTR